MPTDPIPRRRKYDNLQVPCPTPGCAAIEVLYERVGRIESTVHMRFDTFEEKLLHLNELRQEVIEDRGQFVSKEIFDGRLRTLERMVWMALGGGMALGGAAEFFLRHL
jgi:hypothetical protein